MFEIDFGNNQTFGNVSAEDGVITNVLMKNINIIVYVCMYVLFVRSDKLCIMK